MKRLDELREILRDMIRDPETDRIIRVRALHLLSSIATAPIDDVYNIGMERHKTHEFVGSGEYCEHCGYDRSNPTHTPQVTADTGGDPIPPDQSSGN